MIFSRNLQEFILIFLNFLSKQSFQNLLFRDNLDFNQAHARLASQPTNEALVSQSTVVLSPQWSYLFTHDQVNRYTKWSVIKMLIRFFMFLGNKSMGRPPRAPENTQIAIFNRFNLKTLEP